MEQYIPKSALLAKIEKIREYANENWDVEEVKGIDKFIDKLESYISTLEVVKEVDLDVIQRMKECPYRQVGCTMYEGTILECRGACNWVVDYLKLKEYKAQKGE